MERVRTLLQRYKKSLLEILAGIALLIIVIFIAFHLSPYDLASTGQGGSGNGSSKSEYYEAVITSMTKDGATIKLLDGPRAGQTTSVGDLLYLTNSGIGKGASILVQDDGSGSLTVTDRWRIPVLIVLLFLFVMAVVFVGRRRGMMSFFGLIVNICILFFLIIPGILKGYDTFTVIMAGSMIISVVSIYVAHGASRRTTISVISILCIVLFVSLLSWLSVDLVGLTGKTDEVSANLSVTYPHINFSGLLAGSIVLATIGVLDDVVTTQVATIDNLSRAKKKQSFAELFRRGSDVGREHIAALVNTLALVYVGISFPTILLYSTGGYESLLLLFNSEFIAQELTRTIITSIGLLLAVPLSTGLAVILCRRWQAASQPRNSPLTEPRG